MVPIDQDLLRTHNKELFNQWCEHPVPLLNSLFMELRKEESYEKVVKLIRELKDIGFKQTYLIVNLEKFRTANDILNESDEYVEQNAIDALNFVYLQL